MHTHACTYPPRENLEKEGEGRKRGKDESMTVLKKKKTTQFFSFWNTSMCIYMLIERTDERGWMDGWMDGRMDGWTDGWMDGWMDGWTDGWMDGWMDGRMDGWMID